MDLRHFHYALVSAEHGSFRRAAAVLNVQQSTVSRGVRSLENLVGAELFERGHAGIRPTSVGDWFLQEATLGFDHLERAVQRVGALRRGECGDLRVGVSVPLTVVGDAFEQFRKECGGVSVEIVESTTGASSALIQQRKLDVAFVANSPADRSLRSLHLRDEPIIVVLPKSHRLATAPKLVLEELRNERIILSTGGLGPDIADHLMRRLAKPEGEPNLQLHSVGQFNLIDMVAREFGVTITVGLLPQPEWEKVVFIPLAGRNVTPLYAVWMASNPNPALKRLLHILRKGARSGLAAEKSGSRLSGTKDLARAREAPIGCDEAQQHGHDQSDRVDDLLS
jgi:DNA-binding transcriptional LysR family regulator